ncbi:MAG: SOUL family heme-binding protein [Pseudobdellovibrionaceae bacterium]
MAIEEPDYTVESKGANYELRSYGPILVAETKVEADFENAGNQAFRILAGYIFGANKSKTKIAMTAPVNQEVASEKIEMTAPVTQIKGPSGFLVQFTMPKKYTMETLPIPNDSRVLLRQLPARKIAVYSYSGSWSESRYNDKLASFKEELKRDGVVTVGEPVLARYNSPFQIWFLRRNEIWVEVKEKTLSPESNG